MRHHINPKLGALTGAIAITITLALSAGAAQAALTITEVGPFGSEGAGQGQFKAPLGAAVNQSSNDVYVADSTNKRVQEFGPSGVFIREFTGSATPEGATKFTPEQVAVSPAGDVWVLNAALSHYVVDEFSEEGVYIGTITSSSLTGTAAAAQASTFKAKGIAIDPSTGKLYVLDGANGYVDVFSASGIYESQFGGGKGSAVGEIEDSAAISVGVTAVDSSGDVYVVDIGNERVEEFAPSGGTYTATTFFQGTAEEKPYAVAVDTETGDIYVGSNHVTAGIYVVDIYEPGNTTALTEFTLTGAGQSEGIAVDAKSGLIYVPSYGKDDVDIFSQGPGKCEPEPKVASSGAASSVGVSSATLTGELNPEGCASATYDFAYGTTTEYGQTAPESASLAPVASSPEAVTTQLTGLQPNTTYHFQLVVHSGDYSKGGADETFKTAHEAPVAATTAPSAVAQSVATLNATVNPEHTATTYSFQYGTTTAYGQEAPLPAAPAGEGLTPQAVSASLSGLTPNTTYHYRVVASNSVGETDDGADQSFTTTLVPAPLTGSPGPISQSSVTVEGIIDPAGVQSTYQFQYGTTTAYGSATAAYGAGSAEADERESATLTGLTPNTTYHYRLLITDIAGSTYGEDQTFTTYPEAPAPSPLVLSIGPGAGQLTLPSTLPTLPASNTTTTTTTTPPSKPPTTKPKALTKAQQLKKAVKQCKIDNSKKKRATCESKARAKYAPKPKPKKKTKK